MDHDNNAGTTARDRGDVSNSRGSVAGFDGLLFDMDGTVLTSIVAVERVWTRWAQRHGLDVATFLPTVHGVRAIETVRNSGVTGIDVEAEVAAIVEAGVNDTEGVEAIAGASQLLTSLPRERWAIVTSAPRRLAQSRIAAAGLPQPPVLVSGDDVAQGKPAPDAFMLGAERLGCDVRDCLVFEDAVAGIQSAEAAGAAIVIVTAVHTLAPQAAHPSITDYRQLHMRLLADNRIGVRIG